MEAIRALPASAAQAPPFEGEKPLTMSVDVISDIEGASHTLSSAVMGSTCGRTRQAEHEQRNKEQDLAREREHGRFRRLAWWRRSSSSRWSE